MLSWARLWGGAYIPNYVLILSGATTGLRNLSLLALVTPAASFSPALYGALADRFGFPASFMLALAVTLCAIGLVGRIRTGRPAPERVLQ